MPDDKFKPRHIVFNGTPMVQTSSSGAFVFDKNPPEGVCTGCGKDIDSGLLDKLSKSAALGAEKDQTIRELRQKLKVMTEDRDEFAAKPKTIEGAQDSEHF